MTFQAVGQNKQDQSVANGTKNLGCTPRSPVHLLGHGAEYRGAVMRDDSQGKPWHVRTGEGYVKNPTDSVLRHPHHTFPVRLCLIDAR